MTNQDAWTQYKEYSKATSDIARKMAFAGIAVCWLFRETNNSFPSIVFNALIFLLIFFIFDLLQYLVSTLLVKNWIRKEEIKMWESTGKIEGNYQNPEWLDLPAFTFFLLKIIALIVSFVFLGIWLFT